MLPPAPNRAIHRTSPFASVDPTARPLKLTPARATGRPDPASTTRSRTSRGTVPSQFALGHRSASAKSSSAKVRRMRTVQCGMRIGMCIGMRRVCFSTPTELTDKARRAAPVACRGRDDYCVRLRFSCDRFISGSNAALRRNR